jgi:hypothetical protein
MHHEHSEVSLWMEDSITAQLRAIAELWLAENEYLNLFLGNFIQNNIHGI